MDYMWLIQDLFYYRSFYCFREKAKKGNEKKMIAPPELHKTGVFLVFLFKNKIVL